MKALLRVTSNIKAPAHSCFTDFTVLEKTVSGNASICLSHKKNSMKNWSKTTCQTNPVTQFANRPFLRFLIFTDTAQLIPSLSHLIAWTQDIRFPTTQEKLKVTFWVGFKLLELCTTAALSSITNGSETLTFWHCFEDTSRVLLHFKLTPKLYHPNFLRNKKTKHIKQAENKENTFKKAITCEISWVITLTKEYLFLRI